MPVAPLNGAYETISGGTGQGGNLVLFCCILSQSKDRAATDSVEDCLDRFGS